MVARSLTEAELGRFLRRRRRRPPALGQTPLGRFLVDTLELVARLVPCEAAVVLLDDPAAPKRRAPLSVVAAFGAAEPLVGVQVPRGSSPLRALADRSRLAAPIRLERAVSGALELANRRGKRGFDARDAELVELFARYIGRAVLNAVDLAKHEELALRDETTGLGNVRALHPFLTREARRASRTGSALSVIFLDVDRLKAINAKHGHRAGTEALRRVGLAVADVTHAPSRAFRFGGDELVLVSPGLDGREAAALAERARREIARRTPGAMRGGGRLPAIGVSAGVATLPAARARQPNPELLAARLLAAADQALFRAKRRGGGHVALAK